jgi:5-hydroxyisourate hydrolase
MISTHVLDVALGRPASGLALRLEVLETNATWTMLRSTVTDIDGRSAALAEAVALAGRTCRLGFDTRAYFAATGRPCFFPWVEVVFVVDGGERHHVPLLLSPFGYSTYRGS